MKTEAELKEWFFDLYHSCYIVKHEDYPKSDFLYYDIDFIRKRKFNEILDKEIEYPTKPNGICLFELEWRYNYMWIKYDEIWSVFKTEYQDNYQNIRTLINGWLGEVDKLKVLTPITLFISVANSVG